MCVRHVHLKVQSSFHVLIRQPIICSLRTIDIRDVAEITNWENLIMKKKLNENDQRVKQRTYDK